PQITIASRPVHDSDQIAARPIDNLAVDNGRGRPRTGVAQDLLGRPAPRGLRRGSGWGRRSDLSQHSGAEHRVDLALRELREDVLWHLVSDEELTREAIGVGN